MKITTTRALTGRPSILVAAFLACSSLSAPSWAGDHHKQVYYLPVQAAAAPAVQVVAAAPVQLVAVQPKHHRAYLVQATPVQAAQTYQVASAPVATTMVAAAPVMMTLVPTTVATAAAPAAGSPVAASPTVFTSAAPAPTTIVINGRTYVLQGTASTGGNVGASPTADLGALKQAQRDKIVQNLKALAAELKASGLTDEAREENLRKSAERSYEEAAGDTVDTDAEKAAVKSMVNDALNLTSTSSDSNKSTSGTGQQQQPTAATMYMTVPAASAAPVQYFLPVQVKHHPFHPYQ